MGLTVHFPIKFMFDTWHRSHCVCVHYTKQNLQRIERHEPRIKYVVHISRIVNTLLTMKTTNCNYIIKQNIRNIIFSLPLASPLHDNLYKTIFFYCIRLTLNACIKNVTFFFIEHKFCGCALHVNTVQRRKRNSTTFGVYNYNTCVTGVLQNSWL